MPVIENLSDLIVRKVVFILTDCGGFDAWWENIDVDIQCGIKDQMRDQIYDILKDYV